MSDLRFLFALKGREIFKIPGRISSMALWRCRNERPIKGLVRFVMTTSFSLNVISLTSNCNFTVAISASNCPLATILWNSGGGPSFNFVFAASNRIFGMSASGMTLQKASVSMSTSIFNSPKSIGKYSILRLFFEGKSVDTRRNFVSPCGVT